MNHPDKFHIHYELIPNWIAGNKKIRLTLDTLLDFELQREIYMGLSRQNETFDLKEIITFLEEYILSIMMDLLLENSQTYIFLLMLNP